MSAYKNKELAEDIARNLRCCGVDGARVVETVMYEVVVPQSKTVTS